MSNFTKSPVPYILDCEPMPIFSFIKSEPKEPEQISQNHLLPHINYEVKEEAMPFIPIKIEPEEMGFIPIKTEQEEMGFIPVKIEPEDNHVQENQESNFNSQREVNHEGNLSNEDAFFLHTTFKKCNACERTFESDKKFIRHARINHQYEWMCTVCCQVLPSAKILKKHMKQKHIRDIPCTLCSKRTYDEDGMKRHFRLKHGRSNFSTMRKEFLRICR